MGPEASRGAVGVAQVGDGGGSRQREQWGRMDGFGNGLRSWHVINHNSEGAGCHFRSGSRSLGQRPCLPHANGTLLGPQGDTHRLSLFTMLFRGLGEVALASAAASISQERA